MKKYLFTLLIIMTSLCAYSETNFTPSCSANDGISYVQGQTWVANATPYIKLDGYGKYQNATAVVIVYSKGWDNVEREWYRKTVKITNGTSGNVQLSSLNNASRVEVKVANYCN